MTWLSGNVWGPATRRQWACRRRPRWPSMRWRVRRFKASAITPVSDGTALASWPDSAGSGDPAVQASGGAQPVYKIAANGINGVAAVRFSGGQFMRTAAGGAPYGGATTPWYMASLFRLSSLGSYGHAICWGDDSATGTRRSILWHAGLHVLEFNGLSSDLCPPGEGTIASDTPYFAEAAFDGTYIYFWLNGKLKTIGVPSNGALTASTNARSRSAQTIGRRKSERRCVRNVPAGRAADARSTACDPRLHRRRAMPAACRWR